MHESPPSQRRRIFAFTGLPGVGKSAVVNEMASFMGYPVVNMGIEMKKLYTAMPVGDDRKPVPEGTWEMAQALRAEHGSAGTAMASTSRVAASFIESNVVIVDGVRSVAEVEFFEETFECPVHAVAVTADEDTRLERFTERAGYYEAFEEMDESGKVAEAMGEYEMAQRTKRESKEGLRDVIEYSNYTITNNGSLSDAGMQVARLLDDFDPILK